MTPEQSEIRKYLGWYAQQDMFAPVERRVTWVMCGTFACNLFLLILAGTAAFAMPVIQEHRLKTALLARSIWVGQHQNKDMHLTPDRLNVLKRKLTSYLPDSPPQIHGFYKIDLRFCATQGDQLTKFFGRTISDDDPLLQELAQRDPEINSRFPGIIASHGLLEKLGLTDTDVRSLQVQLEANTANALSLPCRHISGLRLPCAHSFLIREAAYHEAYRKCSEKTASSYVLQWPWEEFNHLQDMLRGEQKFEHELEEFEEILDGLDLSPGPPNRGMSMLRLRSSLSREERLWDDCFKKLAEIQEKVKLSGHTASEAMVLWDPHPEDLTIAEWNPPQTGFSYAEVRVNSVDDLSKAAAACREAGYPADDVLVQQVKNVQDSGRVLRWAVGIISALVLVSSVIVVAALQHLRWRQKAPETGMLRILGIKTQELGAIQNHQSCVLWLYSVFWVVAVWIVTASVMPFLFDTAEAEILLTVSFVVTLVVVAVALPLIRIALHFATRTARSISPLDALLGNES
ncbi:MAG: hypothetical protein ACKO2L_16530 [Planctomycetaceae bacterium]